MELPASIYLKQERNSRSWRTKPRAADGTRLSQSPAWGSADERARARERTVYNTQIFIAYLYAPVK